MEQVKGTYALRFELNDELGLPIKNVPYRVGPAGQANDGNEHLADHSSAEDGRTPVISTTEGESYDYHVVWAKVSTHKALEMVHKNQ
jgi:hypothetical protein